jgi:aspartate aminotransferase
VSGFGQGEDAPNGTDRRDTVERGLLMQLAQRVQELASSATLAVSAKAARMKAQGIDVVGFGAGQPDFPTPAHIAEAGIAAIRAGQTGYSNPASGLPAVKQAVRAKFARENDLTYTPEQVIVTAGGKMACYLLVLSVVNPGDEVIIPRPYWVSYPEMVKLAGGVPVYVAGPAERDYKLSPAELAGAVTDRTRLVLFNSPSNPSGVTYDPDEVRALARALAGTNLWVLSDEIYDRLLLDGQQTLSFGAVDEEAYRKTITVNSASKTYAMPGWRLGYAGGPTEVIAAMAKLQSQSTSGAATFCQIALAEALNGDQSEVQAMRAEFERRGNHMWRRLCAMSGVSCPRPTGAFYCFPNVSGTYGRLGVGGSVAFADRLLEEARVAVVPGAAFGMDDHVRVSFATGMDQIEKGLDRLAALLA